MRTEAQSADQRVVREFADQTALANPSRRQLRDTFGVSEVRTTRESEALLRSQRDLSAAREELERSRASERRYSRELATTTERSSRPMSIEEARLELVMTERRMADIKAKVEIGVAAPDDLRVLMAQHERDGAGSAVAGRARDHRTRPAGCNDAEPADAQEHPGRDDAGPTADRDDAEEGGDGSDVARADPQMLQLQRDLLALQRKADEVSASQSRKSPSDRARTSREWPPEPTLPVSFRCRTTPTFLPSRRTIPHPSPPGTPGNRSAAERLRVHLAIQIQHAVAEVADGPRLEGAHGIRGRHVIFDEPQLIVVVAAPRGARLDVPGDRRYGGHRHQHEHGCSLNDHAKPPPPPPARPPSGESTRA